VITLELPYWQFLIPVQGVFIIFLFTLQHETTHRTAFESRWLNDLVSLMCSYVLFLPREWFRYFHFAHHRHTQDPEQDPELGTAKPTTLKQYLFHISGIPVWYSQIRTLCNNASGNNDDRFIPENRRSKVSRESRVMLIVYAGLVLVSLSVQSSLLLYLWIIPIVIGQPFLRMYLLAEHANCEFVDNIYKNTRTTYTHRLLCQLAWCMPYHAEHHAYPSVPFFRLKELNDLIRDQLEVSEKGYITFNRKYLQQTSKPVLDDTQS